MKEVYYLSFYFISVILMRYCGIVRSLLNFNLCHNLLILISDKNQGDNECREK